MEFFKTSKGRDLLLYKNNEFTFLRQNKNENVWICSLGGNLKNSTKCPAVIKTNLENSKVLIDQSVLKHNHLPHVEKIEKRRLMLGIKEGAEKTKSISPSALVNECRGAAPQTIDNSMATDESLCRMIRRYRGMFRPSEPSNVSDIEFHSEKTKPYGYSLDGDAFLQYDSHDEQDLGDKEKRILLFGSNQNLGYLANSPSVYLDGTFSICPKLFFQLYLFVGIVNGTFLPLAFALLTGKTKDIYTELFRALCQRFMELGLTIRFERISLDFECAAIMDVEEVFHWVRTHNFAAAI